MNRRTYEERFHAACGGDASATVKITAHALGVIMDLRAGKEDREIIACAVERELQKSSSPSVEAPAPSIWQPMDTAPKDRPILGRDDGVCAVVEWWDRGEWWLTVFDADSADGGEWTPDEWMEIPE